MKEPIYGLETETSYKNKEGKEVQYKYPKIKINGKTLQEGTNYAITILKTAELRTINSNGKTMIFGSAFVKYTSTDYAFAAEISEYLANQLNKYPPGTDLILTKEWYDNKQTGAKMPKIKVEMAKYNQTPTNPQKTLNVNGTEEKPYQTKEEKLGIDNITPKTDYGTITKKETNNEEIDDFDKSAWKSFTTTEKRQTKYNWLDYYSAVNGNNLTKEEESKAIQIYEKMTKNG